MKKGPIGVWFSVALAILVLSVWVGSKLGARVAQYWYRHQQQGQIALQGPARAHMESVVSELGAIQTLKLFSLIDHYDEDPRGQYLRVEIAGLERLRNRSTLPEVRPVIDLNLGLAYLDAAIRQDQNNEKELATKYMKSAQTLFQSLGWQDYSEETLQALAKRQHDTWKPKPQTKEGGK